MILPAVAGSEPEVNTEPGIEFANTVSPEEYDAWLIKIDRENDAETAALAQWAIDTKVVQEIIDEANSPKYVTTSLSSGSGAGSGSNGGTNWDDMAYNCEAKGYDNPWGVNTGNGYFGGLQFDSGTWDAYGNPLYEEASDAPREEQIAAANRVPYDAWPNC